MACPGCEATEARADRERRERVKRGREIAALRLRLREALVALADVTDRGVLLEERVATLERENSDLLALLRRFDAALDRAAEARHLADRRHDALALRAAAAVPADRRS